MQNHTGGTYDYQQLACRARHDGGLIWEYVKSGRRTIQQNLRVVADKRLIESLTDDQQAAMWFLAKAWGLLTAGVGMRTFDPSHVRGGAGDVSYGAAIIAEYFKWAEAVLRRKLDHSMCMDVIAYGHSLRDVDRNRRQPRGTAKKNLVGCLDLCIDLRPKMVQNV
jgi:hypothetical protein